MATVTYTIRPGEDIEVELLRYDGLRQRVFAVRWRYRYGWFWARRWHWLRVANLYNTTQYFSSVHDALAEIDSFVRLLRGRAEGWVPVEDPIIEVLGAVGKHTLGQEEDDPPLD